MILLLDIALLITEGEITIVGIAVIILETAEIAFTESGAKPNNYISPITKLLTQSKQWIDNDSERIT